MSQAGIACRLRYSPSELKPSEPCCHGVLCGPEGVPGVAAGVPGVAAGVPGVPVATGEVGEGRSLCLALAVSGPWERQKLSGMLTY